MGFFFLMVQSVQLRPWTRDLQLTKLGNNEISLSIKSIRLYNKASTIKQIFLEHIQNTD